MKTTFRVANLIAIAGTAWMAFLILLMRFSPQSLRSISAYRWVFMILTITELIFALSFLFFFICFHLYNRMEGRVVVPGYATIAALVGAAWMSIVAVLHRFPAAWHWLAMRESGLIVALTQVVLTIPLLLFFVVFSMKHCRVQFTLRLRVATITSIVALSWFLLVSATWLSFAIQRWLIESGVGRVMIITEPAVALSILFFLVMFYLEPRVWGPGQKVTQPGD